MHSYRFLIRSDFPYAIRQAIRRAASGDAALGERAVKCMNLYRAVICRAIADALEKTGLEDRGEHRTAVREAREFFHDGGEWFEFVFLNSGIDASLILPYMLVLDPAEPPAPRSQREKV